MLFRSRLVDGEVGADEPGDIVDRAAHLPALDHIVDPEETLLESRLPVLLVEDDLGEDIDGPLQVRDVYDGLVSGYDFRRFEAAHALEARARRQSHPLGQLLNGRAPVALKGRQYVDVNAIQCGRASCDHGCLNGQDGGKQG